MGSYWGDEPRPRDRQINPGRCVRCGRDAKTRVAHLRSTPGNMGVDYVWYCPVHAPEAALRPPPLDEQGEPCPTSD